ncbi:hemerythrin domain-containing protein [Mycobacterium sp. M1]|uniref:Hemerythrin domain-containing protein n=1 Tax=Mycolicibacter acidiphilus TaxID=2835306 RepID=A0ABS5RLS8_9MYCO|nr:hemerythrin domain-containing protein [Mycolicibacter acidiphilus]MBS9535258.1 hemerythrin domain-containing protein [Mycolicibacter acidiphilus]
MADETLSVAMKHEHHEVDEGIEAFVAKLDGGVVDADGLHSTLNILRRHAYMEENFIFPPLRQGHLMMSIFGMLRGHGEIWRTMDVAEQLAADGSDHDKIRATCEQLLAQLAQHNKVEEAVVYAGADVDLEPAKAAEWAAFIDGGTMPDGWVCEKAAG